MQLWCLCLFCVVEVDNKLSSELLNVRQVSLNDTFKPQLLVAHTFWSSSSLWHLASDSNADNMFYFYIYLRTFTNWRLFINKGGILLSLLSLINACCDVKNVNFHFRTVLSALVSQNSRHWRRTVWLIRGEKLVKKFTYTCNYVYGCEHKLSGHFIRHSPDTTAFCF